MNINNECIEGGALASYLAVDELSRAGVSRPARTHGARAHNPVDVMNETPLHQPGAELHDPHPSLLA